MPPLREASGIVHAPVNIRPGVSVLSVLRHLNYKPWFALGEFVDNSVQSFLQNRERLQQLHGDDVQCEVHIRLDTDAEPRIVVRDNAAGIAEEDYPRAFRAAEIPPDRTGLSEFGMGMKSAACWFAPRWHVRTSAIGEPLEKTISFDIAEIVRDSVEELDVRSRITNANDHFTEIVLDGLYKTPQGTTVRKIKDHLASIYRVFLRAGELRLWFNDELLTFHTPAILSAPYYREPQAPAREWKKEIDFDFGLGLRARGFAALRERGSTSDAGFALFRRRRLIEGSGDEGYRPEFIFGRSNSYRYQRLFGELELEGFEVSHTKDGFAWDENEEAFLTVLKEHLDSDELPLLEQAEEYRARIAREELRTAAEAATERTAGLIAREAPAVMQRLGDATPVLDPPAQLIPLPAVTRRTIEAELRGQQWRIILELTDNPAVGDWIELCDGLIPAEERNAAVRSVGVRLALNHPFSLRFAGPNGGQLEVLVRVAAAVGLAVFAARACGVREAGTVSRNINELLRNALSSP